MPMLVYAIGIVVLCIIIALILLLVREIRRRNDIQQKLDISKMTEEAICSLYNLEKDKALYCMYRCSKCGRLISKRDHRCFRRGKPYCHNCR